VSLDPFADVVAALVEARVRFVVIGIAGANYYARSGSTIFTTADYDLLLPPDPDNELAAWRTCETAGLRLRSPSRA